MALLNGLPVPAFPGLHWSASAPAQVQELVTTFDTEEIDALAAAPDLDCEWASVGTRTSVGFGTVKVIHRLPQASSFTPFTPGGSRKYNTLDIAATLIRVSPFALNFMWPTVWDQMGSYMLMNPDGQGGMVEFTGASGIATTVIDSGRAYKAQLAASLIYSGYTSSALGMTASALTMPQPGLPNGNPLFTDGSGSPLHYSNPLNANSGRFKNAYPAFGTFATSFGKSLVVMGQKPHPTLPNVTSGARVTDVIGPTHMRDRFWQMAVQNFVLQTTTTPGNLGAAVSNPYASEILRQFNPDTFIGAAGFGPQRFWIAPQLDNHPYFDVTANKTNGPGGGPADMWINICADPKRGSWAKFAASSKDFTPVSHFYGPGDPQANSQRMARVECDLDAGVSAGTYGLVDLFFGV